jgi:hypothetical protein
MHRTARRTALCPLSGIQTVRMPRSGWRREDPGAGDGGTGGSGHDPNAGGTTPDGDGAGKDGDGKTPKIQGDFDPERAAADLGKARESERKAKAEKKASDDRLAAVLKALGLNQDGKADPEEQAKQLTTRAEQAEARATRLAIKNAIRDGADTHKANAAELLDSQSFLKKLSDLDATADDFDDKVADLVKAAVKSNPAKFGAKTGQGTGRMGADHTGGASGEGRPKSLREAFARKTQ